MPRALLVPSVSLALAALLIAAGEHFSRPPDLGAPAEAKLRAIDGRTTLAPVIATAPRTAAGYSARSDGDFGELELSFTPAPAAMQLGAYFTSARRVVQVALNGRVLVVDVAGRSDSPVGDQGALLATFPESLLREGENVLQVVVASTPESVDEKGAGDKELWPVYVGAVSEVRGAFHVRRALGGAVIAVALGAMLFVALICVAVPWRMEDVAASRALAVLLGVWSVLSGLYLGLDSGFSFEARFVAFMAVRLALVASFVVLAFEWTRRGQGAELARRWVRPAVGVSVLGVVVATVAGELVVASVVSSVGGIVGAGVVLATLARGARGPRARVMELVFASVAALLCAFDAAAMLARHTALASMSAPLSAYTPVGGLIVSLTLVVALSLRMADALRADLAAQRALVGERQRIMQDMHDGIGHHLVGLILQTKADRLDKAALLEGLEQSLEDLRLMVDSLEQAGDSLELALGAFRGRLEPRCEALGIRLEWAVDEELGAVELGSTGILHLYRILQEAFANAVRHGKARTIAIALRRSAALAGERAALELSLRDDGAGFSIERVKRRGLLHMRRRAEAIGGALEIESGSGGTTVRVRFPLMGAAQSRTDMMPA